MSEQIRFLIFVILLSFLLFMVTGCATRLVTLNKAYHYNDSPYNENLRGYGFEVNVKDDWWAGALRYKNSFENRSTMLTIGHEWELRKKWWWGFKMGIANGYDIDAPFATIGGLTLRWKFLGPVSTYVFITPILTANGFTIDL